ncbi:LOW QUALITY PROTEIN: Helitron helicase [Phytophthora megakarya]|uniref:Helitron helicase n=1 Tax=Phytophthora megakarya TaxID=4795 RepID=A0A225V2K9_9STRA|nr:LOW QUALITY PROTEIN: Helitron helicase [Phytophthora megakarya]
MPEEEYQIIQKQNIAGHQAARYAMTEEEHERHKEAEQFRRRSRQYQKGLSYYEDFDPSIIPGGHPYFSRYTDDAQEHEAPVHIATLGSFQMKQTEAAVLRRLYRNPGFKQLIRAYKQRLRIYFNGILPIHLNVDESITRSQTGVYNYRVVCDHRMGSLLPPPNRRPMYAQVYINDPDIQARVASQMDMTDGLDKDILETIDQVMITHNSYSQ